MGNSALPAELSTLPLRIDPRQIGYLKFILEGYDNMALVTTIDSKEGLIIIRYSSTFHGDLMAIIEDLSPLISPEFTEQDDKHK
jgi:hypothetical protein